MSQLAFKYELYTESGEPVLAQSISGARMSVMLEHIAKKMHETAENHGGIILKMVEARLEDGTLISDEKRMESLNTMVILAAEHYYQEAKELVVEDYSLQPKTQHDYNTRRSPNQTSFMRKMLKRGVELDYSRAGEEKRWNTDALKKSKDYNGHPSDRPKRKGMDQLSGSWISDAQEKSIHKSVARNLKKVLANPKKTQKLKEMIGEAELQESEGSIRGAMKGIGYKMYDGAGNMERYVHKTRVPRSSVRYSKRTGDWSHFPTPTGEKVSGNGIDSLHSQLKKFHGLNESQKPGAVLKPSAEHIAYLDKKNDSQDYKNEPHSQHYKDKTGKKLSTEISYHGYNKGIYKVAHPGKHVSLVQKTHSGKGVPVQNPELKTLHNKWLRPATMNEIELPSLDVGDILKVGKFKNRAAEIEDFSTDEHGQPVAKTTKGDQKIFKPRIAKLEPGAEPKKDAPIKESFTDVSVQQLKMHPSQNALQRCKCGRDAEYNVNRKSTMTGSKYSDAMCKNCAGPWIDTMGKKTKQV